MSAESYFAFFTATSHAPARLRAEESAGLAVLMYVKYPLSLRNAEDLLAERGIDISHETVRYRWNRFGPLFAGDIR